MVGALFDTNILIDYLNGATKARSELALYDRRAISVITRMEVLIGTDDETDAPARAFLRTFDTIDLDAKLAERAIDLRKRFRTKLPDAIVWATAQAHGLLFVTRNTKDFSRRDPGIRIPYALT